MPSSSPSYRVQDPPGVPGWSRDGTDRRRDTLLHGWIALAPHLQRDPRVAGRPGGLDRGGVLADAREDGGGALTDASADVDRPRLALCNRLGRSGRAGGARCEANAESSWGRPSADVVSEETPLPCSWTNEQLMLASPDSKTPTNATLATPLHGGSDQLGR